MRRDSTASAAPAFLPALLERGEGIDTSAAVTALLRAVARLEQTVDEETAALRERRADLRDFNNRKSQGLLELSRAMRPLEGAAPAGQIAERLAALRGKLEVNQALLKRHLDAVAEISGIVAKTIRDGESDGTYSTALSKRG